MDNPPNSDPETSVRSLHLLVVDLDPITRAGLVACLNRFTDLQVEAEAETVAQALEIVIERQAHPVEAAIDVILSGLPLQTDRSEYSGLNLLQQINTLQREPPTKVPVLVWVNPLDPGLSAALALGASGCCFRGNSLLDIVASLRRVGAGQTDWPLEATQQLSTQRPKRAKPRTGWMDWRDRLHSSGLFYIEESLNAIQVEVHSPARPWLEQQILVGRRRELYAARWLLNRLYGSGSEPSEWEDDLGRSQPLAPLLSHENFSTPGVVVTEANLTPKVLQSQIFDRIAIHLQSSLENLTASPLEIDILREDKKRELLYLIVRQTDGLLDELRFSRLTPEQLSAKCPNLMLDLWQSVTRDFFGRYYTLPLSDQAVEVVSVLLQETRAVNTQILSRIPLMEPLLSHLLFQTPLMIDNASYEAGSAIARDRAIALLENLMIQVANAVIQPLLNRFADSEALKQSLYDRRLLSTREIERFRNDLSWRYRIDQYFKEPKAIFESQYRLLVFTPYGIQPTTIYAPRGDELTQMKGIPLVITLAIETRDALSPRLQSIASFLGRGIVYLLTEIIGRGIGLVGRGILKGVGNILYENRSSRES